MTSEENYVSYNTITERLQFLAVTELVLLVYVVTKLPNLTSTDHFLWAAHAGHGPLVRIADKRTIVANQGIH
jgi:hypothetical protein